MMPLVMRVQWRTKFWGILMRPSRKRNEKGAGLFLPLNTEDVSLLFSEVVFFAPRFFSSVRFPPPRLPFFAPCFAFFFFSPPPSSCQRRRGALSPRGRCGIRQKIIEIYQIMLRAKWYRSLSSLNARVHVRGESGSRFFRRAYTALTYAQAKSLFFPSRSSRVGGSRV